MKKVIFAMPSRRGDIRVETMSNIISHINFFNKQSVDCGFISVCYAEVAIARNKLAYSFLNSDADLLIMQDDDVTVENSILKRMLEYEQDFIGVFLPQRKLDLNRFAAAIKQGSDLRQAQIAANPAIGLGKAMDNSINRVSAIGGGFLMLRKAVFQKIISAGKTPVFEYKTPNNIQKMYGFFNNITTDAGFMGEDYSFCNRYTEAGGEVFAYHGPGITHYGNFAFQS